MKWFYCKKETFEPIKNVNPIRGTFYLGFSKIELAKADEDGNDMKFLLIRHDAPLHIDLAKPLLLDLVKQYDKSDDVNTVYIGTDKTWFDKDTRVGLINSLKIQKEAGKTNTILWYNVGEELKNIEMTIDSCLDFFYRLELYAENTFNVTQTHIQEIAAIETVEDLVAYNVTKDYPVPIKLTV